MKPSYIPLVCLISSSTPIGIVNPSITVYGHYESMMSMDIGVGGRRMCSQFACSRMGAFRSIFSYLLNFFISSTSVLTSQDTESHNLLVAPWAWNFPLLLSSFPSGWWITLLRCLTCIVASLGSSPRLRCKLLRLRVQLGLLLTVKVTSRSLALACCSC
jgi:hypothetical protein